jgi:2-deoxy-D-gluconate 3-dehydrogenase
MDFKLAGKVAIVTGASRGLGYQMALALAGQGVKALAVARSIDDLKDLQSRDPQRIAVSQCDMLDAAAVEALPEQALELFGSIDIVVNNAGIAPATPFFTTRL